MPEFAAYVSNRGNQLDWGGITENLVNDIQGIEQSRERKRAEDQAMLEKNQKMLNEPAMNKSQSLNEFILNGAYDGKNKIYDWNKQLKAGKMSRREYQQRMTNLSDDWNNFSVITKSMDQRLQQAMERQQVGANGELPPASAIEAEMQGYFGAMANLKDKGVAIGEDGRVVLATYDGEGNVVKSDDIRYINNPMNIAFNRTDLSSMVKSDVKNWGEWKLNRTTDIRQNPEFKKSKVRLTETLTSSPRSTASILVDNSGEDYTVYFGKDDFNAKFADMKRISEESGENLTDQQIAEKMIAMKQDENGDYQPDLTPSQVAKAKEIVGREIEVQLGRQVDPAPMYRGGDGRDDSPDEGDVNQLVAGYKSTLRAFGFDPNAVRNNINDPEKWKGGQPDFGGLSRSFKYVKKNGQVYVYPASADIVSRTIDDPSNPGQKKTISSKDADNPVFIANQPKDLSQFVYGGQDIAKDQVKWGDARKYWLGGAAQQQQPQQQKSSTPKKGDVVSGYIFMGGDPSNQKNWKKQ